MKGTTTLGRMTDPRRDLMYGSTESKQNAIRIAKALGETLPGRRTAAAYEIAGALYVVATGTGDCDAAYVPDDALRRARGDESAPLVTKPEIVVAYFMASDRSLAEASGEAVLKPEQVVLLSLARGPKAEALR